jgi:C4-dicarboxylate transporter DctQ subunit
MKTISTLYRHLTEGVAAAMMAVVFCTFILQIFVRYAVGTPLFVSMFGTTVNASQFGWTVEFILVLWLWTIFWGNAFIVRERDHVTFDIVYNLVGPRTRTVFALFGAVVIIVALWGSIDPTYVKMKLLRIKSSATLPVKMLPISSIYFLFLAVVGARYLWRVIDLLRHGADREMHVLPYDDFTTDEAEI